MTQSFKSDHPDHRKVVCIDFDGVIHTYTTGWTGPYLFADPPVPGAFEFMEALLEKGYDVVILTARGEHPGMERAVRDWMVYNDFPPEAAQQITVTNVKPPALLYIDDRAIHFSGVFPSMKLVDAFKPWMEKEKK